MTCSNGTFRRPITARRMLLLAIATKLTAGDRPASNLLRLLSLIDTVNSSTYDRLYSMNVAQIKLLPNKGLVIIGAVAEGLPSFCDASCWIARADMMGHCRVRNHPDAKHTLC
jgi:hypothetical protein